MRKWSLATAPKITVDTPKPWEWDELMSLQNYITYVDKLEQLLQIRSPRAEKFRRDVENLKAKSRKYEKKREVKWEKEYRRKREIKAQMGKVKKT